MTTKQRDLFREELDAEKDSSGYSTMVSSQNYPMNVHQIAPQGFLSGFKIEVYQKEGSKLQTGNIFIKTKEKSLIIAEITVEEKNIIFKNGGFYFEVSFPCIDQAPDLHFSEHLEIEWVCSDLTQIRDIRFYTTHYIMRSPMRYYIHRSNKFKDIRYAEQPICGYIKEVEEDVHWIKWTPFKKFFMLSDTGVFLTRKEHTQIEKDEEKNTKCTIC